ncbi:MAG: HAMP domain-containing histidine kinase, partial [candidate division Zixibacteria bacterium]|nr:HAMP domain-containing histidine kinase [candidate division Zixibacteria bacterium]
YLSDLSQVLIEVGDKQALATSSLKFLMMHYKTDCGAVILWNGDQTDSRIVMLNGTEMEEVVLNDDRLAEMIETFQSKPDNKPIIENSESFGSMLEHLSADRESIVGCVACLKPQSQIVRVHVRRRDTLLAILTMGSFPDDQTVETIDLKFLAITSSQLAVSLENLSLLEETQKAYDSLKKLQDETIQLEKMATRGEMSAEIGHELNNFLGVVAGNLSLLEFQINNNHADKAGKYVHAINENIDKIKKFTSNLMDLTPISTAKETVDFGKLLTEVIDYLKPQKRFSGVTINVTPPDGPVPFEADVVHLQQVLYNLFNNAADATSGLERREISVKIDTYPERSRFAVILKDTGVGFDPATLKKAFTEKFTTKKDGHGFGLLVCKRIIDNHDGLLSIESTQGEGSTIRIEFPMATTPARASVTV